MIVISCGVPSLPNSGTTGLSLSYSGTVYNSIATYSCATGYNLIGTSSRVCLSSGSWSGGPPYCQSRKHKYTNIGLKLLFHVLQLSTVEHY